MSRFKFVATQSSPKEGIGPHTATFQIVGGDANADLFEGTPSGYLTLSNLKDQAFATGQEFYVDIKPARAAAEKEESSAKESSSHTSHRKSGKDKEE